MLYPAAELPDDTPVENVRFATRIRNALHAAGMKTIGTCVKFPTLRCLSFQISAAVRYLIFVRPLVSRQPMAWVQRSQSPPDLRRLLTQLAQNRTLTISKSMP
jgi:hypothetical protein